MSDFLTRELLGDMICTECGLVVADRVIDVGSEWRTFSNDTESKDMCRVGDVENRLLSGSDLTTIIGPSGRGKYNLLRSYHQIGESI